MSNSSLRHTLLLINDMSVMPLKQAGVLEYFPEGDLTFVGLREDIDVYGFALNDSVASVFDKYFIEHSEILSTVRERVLALIDPTVGTGVLGEAYSDVII